MTHKGLMHTVGVACLVASLGCGAAATDTALEEARFALDAGDYSTAVTKAQEALTADPNNVQAALVLSSAFSGRAGVTTLDLAEALSGTSATTDAFDIVHDTLVSTIVSGTGLDDLRSAISTLTGFAGTISADELANFSYQTGLLQTIESFALPTMTAQPTTSGTVTATAITAAQAAIVQADLIAADDNMIAGGLGATNVLVDVIRTNYCVLKDLSAGGGFTTAELQDLTLCQLNDNLATLTAANGSFQSPVIANCTTFNFDCTDVDTVE